MNIQSMTTYGAVGAACGAIVWTGLSFPASRLFCTPAGGHTPPPQQCLWIIRVIISFGGTIQGALFGVIAYVALQAIKYVANQLCGMVHYRIEIRRVD